MKKNNALAFSILGLMLLPLQAVADDKIGAFGFHGSIGTDASLGIGFGGGLSYALYGPNHMALEFTADGLVSNSSETYDNDYNSSWEDTEITDLVVGGARANALFNYHPDKGGVFFIAGVGFVFANVEWKVEHRDTGSGNLVLTESDEGTSAGSVANFGIGYLDPSGFEGRFETPLLYFFSQTGNVQFVPTFVLSLGYRIL